MRKVTVLVGDYDYRGVWREVYEGADQRYLDMGRVTLEDLLKRAERRLEPQRRKQEDPDNGE